MKIRITKDVEYSNKTFPAGSVCEIIPAYKSKLLEEMNSSTHADSIKRGYHPVIFEGDTEERFIRLEDMVQVIKD